MKPKVSIFIATSLDGFIAGKNGDLDWLVSDDEPDGEDYGYRDIPLEHLATRTFENGYVQSKYRL